MREVKVRIVAETIITVDTDDLDLRDDLEDYLKGVSVEDATRNQLAVAMVRFDDEEENLDLDGFDWKVIGINTLD